MATEKQIQELLDDIQAWQGYLYPYYEYIVRNDYEYAKSYFDWFKQVKAPRHLPLKYKELLFITAACLKFHETGMRTHITRALQLGATKEEILETIEVATHTGGGGVPVLGVRILMEVLEGNEVQKTPMWVEAQKGQVAG